MAINTTLFIENDYRGIHLEFKALSHGSSFFSFIKRRGETYKRMQIYAMKILRHVIYIHR